MAQKNKRLPSHLLILRTSAMGDVAMLAHAVRALKAAYPQTRVTIATRALFRPFFAGLDVDFLDVDTQDEHHSLRGMWHLAAQARRSGVDALADVHGVLRSMAFRFSMWLHGVPTAGIRKGRAAKRAFIRHAGKGMRPLEHTVSRYCDVFRRLGFRFPDPVPAVRQASNPNADKNANPTPNVTPNPSGGKQAGAGGKQGAIGEKQGVWVGFAPFSAHRGKTYPEGLRDQVVRLLAARYERVFIHSGGGAEAQWAGQMERLHPNVTALFGRVKLAGEIDLTAKLDCVVSMDSLAMHLASLTATPVVSIWGATHPGLGFTGYGSDPRGILQADLPCRPCSVYGKKACRYGDYRCLHAVTPQMIADKVAEVVGK